jgi:hypothetical protein
VLRVLLLSSLLSLSCLLVGLSQGEHDSVIARQQRDRIQADHKARVLEGQRQGGTATHMRCEYDFVCGAGDCWEGFCEAGYCRAYWVCV